MYLCTSAMAYDTRCNFVAKDKIACNFKCMGMIDHATNVYKSMACNMLCGVIHLKLRVTFSRAKKCPRVMCDGKTVLKGENEYVCR